MTREELKPQNKLQREFGRDFTNSEGYFSTDYVEWLENKLLSLPPADAIAEEILDKYWTDPTDDHFNCALKAMHEFAALIADKIVEGKLREELIAYEMSFKDGEQSIGLVDEYLKSRSHE